jgi:hypothetical protein
VPDTVNGLYVKSGGRFDQKGKMTDTVRVHQCVTIRRMKMKRLGKLIGLAGVAAVMMFTATGCLSLMSKIAQAMIKDYGVYDKSVPEDQLCDFIFIAVNILTFNGKPVHWESLTSIQRGGNNMGRIKLPAGNHNFVYEWETTDDTAFSGIISNLEISQIEFLPGHRYSLTGSNIASALSENKVRIMLADITNGRVEMYGDKVANAPKISQTPTDVEGNWKAEDTSTFKFAGNTWEMAIPPGIQTNNLNETVQAKGTFDIDGNKITMYMTHAGRNGQFVNVSGLKTALIYTYSFEGENLNLEGSTRYVWTYSTAGKLLNFEYIPPNFVYTKQ